MVRLRPSPKWTHARAEIARKMNMHRVSDVRTPTMVGWCRNLPSQTGSDARSAEIPARQDSQKRVLETAEEISLLLPPFLVCSRVGWADPKIAVALAVPGCNATVSSREGVRRALFPLSSHSVRSRFNRLTKRLIDVHQTSSISPLLSMHLVACPAHPCTQAYEYMPS